MIAAIVDVLKNIGRPSSAAFIAIVLGVAAGLSLARRTTRVARVYIIALFVGFWTLSTPACAERMVAWSGSGFHPIERAADAAGADLIVVLGGGAISYRSGDVVFSEPSPSTVFRVVEAVRLYHLLGSPTILLSGGVTSDDPGAEAESLAMKALTLRLGVPAERVQVETESKNTRDEAVVIGRMLAGRAGRPLVLVTSPTHMRRALSTFAAQGVTAIPSPSRFVSDGSWRSRRWVPNTQALAVVDAVIYDQVAWLYYWWRGWLGAAPS